MPRRRQLVESSPESSRHSEEPMEEEQEEEDPIRQFKGFKLIAELIAETDRNLPEETIDKDIEAFSTYSDISDWKGIPKFFDSLSSLSRRASTYENWQNRFKVVDYLVSCFGSLKDAVSDYICDYFEAKEAGQEHPVDVDLVHALSMFVILAQRLTVQLQLYVSKSIAAANQTKKTQRHRHAQYDEDVIKWKEVQRQRMINCLIELLELQVDTVKGLKRKAIQYAFVPDVMENDFLERFKDTVSHLLEDPENAMRGSQQWITHYFKIWKILATDYGMARSIATSLFTDTLELGYLETSSTFPFIEPLVTLMKESGETSSRRHSHPIRVILEMVVRRATSLYSGNRLELPPPKAFCMLIQSLAYHCHDLMLQEIVQVYQLLHNPHPNVRISTLQALADLFSSQYLCKQLCDDYQSRRVKRDTIFKKLVAHTNDEATNVRVKAIALLKNLLDNGRLPEEFESCGFLTIVGKRMNDKSVQVRKSAVNFLTVYIDNNRYGHDFNRSDHEIKLDAKIRELKMFDAPLSRVCQEADAEFRAKYGMHLKRFMRREIKAYISGEIRIPDQTQSITCLMQRLFEEGTATGLLQYYVSKEQFPYKRTDADNNREPDSDTVEIVLQGVLDLAKEDFLNYSVQLHHSNDEQMVEDEQVAADKLHTVLQMRAQIQQLIDKMVIEVELSNCIDLALRCVLMGETAEIKEGIKFLTKCKMFEISGAETAIRSMCSLVWRPGADVITELIDAAEDMFISKMDGNEKASERDQSTVDNLMKAMHGATEMDRPSIEEVIYLLASTSQDDEGSSRVQKKRRSIETTVIARLWAIALDNSTGGIEKKIDALRILYPISRTEKGIPEARTRLRSLQKKLTEESAIAVEALRIISILATPTKAESEYNSIHRPIFRIHQDDSLFKSIEKLFFHEVIKADDNPSRDWFGIVRLTIATVLNVSMDVNGMLPKLAAQFLYRAKKISEFYIFYSKQTEMVGQDDLKKRNAIRRRDYWALTWCRVMEKLMAFCGEVAVQLHAFIQVTIPKLHNRYITKMLEAEKNDSTVREEAPRLLSDLEKSIAQRKTIFAVPTDTSPGAAANDLHHLVSLMCDKRLFMPSKLLGRLLPIVAYGMRAKTMPPRVKQAALVAYGKFMPISAEVSSFAAPSFFSAMVRSPSALVRCNLIAACCDFAFAQPTLFELYAPSLFRMSQDQSSAARESAILVLSHLMSNDMIQTRGVLSEPARCICDPTRAVKEVAQSFFKEINQRSDTIVQLLPEFLFRLSSTGERMPFKSYKTVFEFLIQLLKEKTKSNTDTMIDRVCIKFSSIDMNDTEAPKYLLVALAKFAQNDGGIHKLQDNWRHWSKFLCHPQVAREYRQMVEHIKGTLKSEEFKHQCDELLASIEKIQEEGLTKDDMASAPATSKRGRGRKPIVRESPAPSSSQRTPRKRRIVASPLSDVSEVDSDVSMD